MISRETFVRELAIAKRWAEREDDLNAALDKYCGYPQVEVPKGAMTAIVKEDRESDFSICFYPGHYCHLLDLLSELVGDKDLPRWGTIVSSWVYDYNWGEQPLNIYDDNDEIIQSITNAGELYDYIMQNRKVSEDDPEMLALFKAQGDGVKFAINVIDNLRNKNEQTANEDWQEREALLKLAREKIRNEYMIHSGADDPAPDYPIRSGEILRRFNDD